MNKDICRPYNNPQFYYEREIGVKLELTSAREDEAGNPQQGSSILYPILGIIPCLSDLAISVKSKLTLVRQDVLSDEST